MKHNVHPKSLLFGLVAGASIVLALGAVTEKPLIRQIVPLRFIILDITRYGVGTDGKQTAVLKLMPFHGKIDQKGFEFRKNHETQVVSVVTAVDKDYEVRTNDVIDFAVVGHLKLGPGEMIAKPYSP